MPAYFQYLYWLFPLSPGFDCDEVFHEQFLVLAIVMSFPQLLYLQIRGHYRNEVYWVPQTSKKYQVIDMLPGKCTEREKTSRSKLHFYSRDSMWPKSVEKFLTYLFRTLGTQGPKNHNLRQMILVNHKKLIGSMSLSLKIDQIDLASAVHL